MGIIHIQQTDLTITLLTSKQLELTDSCFVCVKSPSGIIKELTAFIVDQEKGVISYNLIDDTVFDEVGNWSIWAKIINSQGLISIGDARKYTFKTKKK